MGITMIDAKNAVLIGAVLFVAALLGLYIPYVQYHNGERVRPETATSTPQGLHVPVLYTNKGFEPETLTVALGTTVEWENVSDKLMWVASDPHPSHTDLPGFNSWGTEGNTEDAPTSWVPTVYAHEQGGFYRYTFTKTGTWTYHNHLVPADRGTIIVEEL